MQQAKSIALCRVSTAEQKTEGHSLERQEDNVKKASEILNAPIIRIWSHDESSRVGKNIKRKDLQEMLEFCKHNKQVRYLIVDEVDRFMRDIKYFYYFDACFEQMGVTVYYASQPDLNSNNMMAKFSKVFHIFKAEASNDERINKTTNGLKGRLGAGYWPFNVHQGYKKTTTPGLHEPDPAMFNLLQKALQEVISREFTPSGALRRLNDSGYTTSSGQRFQIDKFMKVLRNPYYAGIVTVEGWDIRTKGLHQPMITLAEFELLQPIINGRKAKFIRKKNNPEFPLSQIMTCTECGGKLVGFMHSNGKGWHAPKYRCRSCGKQHRRENVNAGLNIVLTDLELDIGKKEDFAKALEQVWREEQRENINHIATLERRLVELQGKKDNLVTALVNTEYPDLKEDIKASVEKVKAEISETENQIREAKNIEKDLVEFVKFALEFTHTLETQWWELDHEDRLKCKELLFPQGFSINHNQKVYTPEISPLYRFITTKKEPENTSDSHLVELRGIAPLSKKQLDNH